MCLTSPFDVTGMVSESKALVRLGVLRRKWPLPILVRTTTPVPVVRKRLEVAL